MKSDLINELAAALVKAQGEFVPVDKASENPFFKSKYADLATVVKTAAPIICKHGLAVSQFVTHDGNGGTLLGTYLIHESGQFITHEMPLLLSKEDPQGQGSAITYARRYSYMAVLGLVPDEDDDGQRASGKKDYSKPQAKPELIPPERMTQLRNMLRDQGLTGTGAAAFVMEAIGKQAPATKEDVEKLIASLEVTKPPVEDSPA